MLQATKKRIAEWRSEREHLRAMLDKGITEDGWPLSPEAKDNLRLDVAECDRVIDRLSRPGGE